jgi:isoquinoline 1-oxidoreductase beta subunit
VNVNHNAIYVECFMDELAHSVGEDPVEFRRKLMKTHPKNLGVLNAVAAKIGWDKPAPQGLYRGIAQHMGFGSYVAAAAEISVGDNKPKVHRIVAATDPGYAINPAQIERQIAGSFVYGLTGLFYGGITIKDGAAELTSRSSAARPKPIRRWPGSCGRSSALSMASGLSACPVTASAPNCQRK